MARRRYKGFKKRPSRSSGLNRKKSYMRWIIVLLVVILAGIFIAKQLGKPKDEIEDFVNHSQQNLGGDKNVRGGGDGSGANNGEPGRKHIDVLPPEKDVETSKETKKRIASAVKEFETDKIISSRNSLNMILHDATLSQKDRADVKHLLAKLSEKWLFSKQIFVDDTLTGEYQVAKGDYFSTIAPKYKVPYEIIMSVNGITDETKLPRRKIKIVKGPFRVRVQLSKFNLDLYLQDQYVKSYKVGIGKPGEKTTTPTGRWRLNFAGKSDKGPTWYPESGKKVLASDPEYPLGARWIPITCYEGDGVGRTGFAIHGTNDPKSIGTRCSLGCIRLRDDDVIEVYNMLAAGISKVDIVK